MNILFLTLVNIKDLNEKQNIYADLCRTLMQQGNEVHIVCPNEEAGANVEYVEYDMKSSLLHVPIQKIQKTNIIRKGIATLCVGRYFKKAICQHHANRKFDLIIYTTPPITLCEVIRFVKKRDNAVTYLLLKDIFPQNAVDLGMLSTKGIKAIIYRYFRQMEKKLYQLSDCIGCMSQKNEDYLLGHNPQIEPDKVHVSPNSFEIERCVIDSHMKHDLRVKYQLPLGKKIYIYGGNLGQPQGVDFIIDCMKEVTEIKDSYFVICGAGAKYSTLEKYVNQYKPKNVKLIPGLPRETYEEFLTCCDVGMIFLDYRFTIPNFPSRILSYMQKGLPVVACTDVVTDIKETILEGGFGWWLPSNDAKKFKMLVEDISEDEIHEKGEKSFLYLEKFFSAERSCEIITNAYEVANERRERAHKE